MGATDLLSSMLVTGAFWINIALISGLFRLLHSSRTFVFPYINLGFRFLPYHSHLSLYLLPETRLASSSTPERKHGERQV